MKYPKQYSLGSEPEEIRVGDLVWWNEGTCVGHVRWIWESERDGDYSWADTEGPPIFLSNKHPYQVGTEPEGVIHDESWAMSEAKGRVAPEHRDMPFCVSTLMDMDRGEEDWHFDFVDEECQILQTMIFPFRPNTRTDGEHDGGLKGLQP
jgi:hypothetical protein